MSMFTLAQNVIKADYLPELKNTKGDIVQPELFSVNTKLSKGADLVLGLSLLPHDILNRFLKSGISVNTVCATAELHGCNKSCLGEFSGHHSMHNGTAFKAQIKRSIMFHFDNEAFLNILYIELLGHAIKAKALGQKVYIRCNVFSDRPELPAKLKNKLASEYPILLETVVFYDYTKIPLKNNTLIDSAIRAYSISQYSMANINKTVSELKQGRFKFSAIVASVETQKELANSSINNVVFISGDKIDNFPVYADQYKSEHIVLMLTPKAVKKTVKTIASEIMALSTNDAIKLYSAYSGRIL